VSLCRQSPNSRYHPVIVSNHQSPGSGPGNLCSEIAPIIWKKTSFPRSSRPTSLMAVFPAWAKSVDEVLEHHSTDPTRGLTAEEVNQRRQQYGLNELEKPPKPSIWSLILEQFDDTLVKVSR
jgi:magnesium-transporting ATPase (P-type)